MPYTHAMKEMTVSIIPGVPLHFSCFFPSLLWCCDLRKRLCPGDEDAERRRRKKKQQYDYSLSPSFVFSILVLICSRMLEISHFHQIVCALSYSASLYRRAFPRSLSLSLSLSLIPLSPTPSKICSLQDCSTPANTPPPHIHSFSLLLKR